MLCKACFRQYLHVFHHIGVLGRGGGGGGGAPKELVHSLLMQFFHSGQLKKRSFQNLFF